MFLLFILYKDGYINVDKDVLDIDYYVFIIYEKKSHLQRGLILFIILKDIHINLDKANFGFGCLWRQS